MTDRQQLSESLEDYLETISRLTEIEGHAHTKKIAECMNVKMPSVTAALKQLAGMGYVEYNTHFPAKLTENGRVVADRIRRRHNVLSHFFSLVLGLPEKVATDTACRLEHLVDESTIERFVLVSDAISRRAEAEELRVFLTDAMRPENMDALLLADCPNGCRVKISCVGRNAGADCFLKVGDVVDVGAIALDSSCLFITLNGEAKSVSRRNAENIWVKKES